jgi:hypothetical protein
MDSATRNYIEGREEPFKVVGLRHVNLCAETQRPNTFIS